MEIFTSTETIVTFLQYLHVFMLLPVTTVFIAGILVSLRVHSLVSK